VGVTGDTGAVEPRDGLALAAIGARLRDAGRTAARRRVGRHGADRRAAGADRRAAGAPTDARRRDPGAVRRGRRARARPAAHAGRAAGGGPGLIDELIAHALVERDGDRGSSTGCGPRCKPPSHPVA